MGGKIRYIGSFSVKTLHALFNKTMLRALTGKFPNEVICYASRSAIPNLDVSGCAEVKNLYLYAGNGKPAVFLRYLLSALHNIRILLFSGKGDILFYNFSNPFSLRIIDRLNRFLKRDVVMCCHSEMEYLSLPRSTGKLHNRLLSSLVRNYFKSGRRPAPGMRFIVLGDVLLKNLMPYLSPEMFSRFVAVDHPYEEESGIQSCGKDEERGNHGILNVGTVGILNEHKGSESYLRLIRLLQGERIPLAFHASGHIQCDPHPFREAGVVMAGATNEPLPYPEFEKAVRRLDYILFFYGKDKYRLTASGALLDAVRFRKPVIALRNDYFEYFFNKFGEIGYLVDDVEEMGELLRHSERLRRNFDFDAVAAKLIRASGDFHIPGLL